MGERSNFEGEENLEHSTTPSDSANPSPSSPSRPEASLERWLIKRFPGLGDGVRGLDGRATTVLISAALLLVVFRKFGSSTYFESVLAPDALRTDSHLSVFGDGYWFLACFVCLGLVPHLMSRPSILRPACLGTGLGDWRFGLKWTGILFIPMFVVVAVVSRFDLFSTYYPLNDTLGHEAVRFFSGQGDVPDNFLTHFVAYEILYAVYFIGWEYFFRGYLTFGLFDRLGAHGVLIGNIPFALMHVGKPFPEALGSIVAGIALGVFALRARSFWYGFFLHTAIAWSMDFWALEARVSHALALGS